MHQLYEQRLKHPADFRVKCNFRAFEDGGRKQLPFQGHRSDFSYGTHPGAQVSTYMVFPEFEDAEGNIIKDNKTPVPAVGTAKMWIVNPARRILHQKILKVGLECFFCEGGRVTADCEVIEILGLFTNPTGEL